MTTKNTAKLFLEIFASDENSIELSVETLVVLCLIGYVNTPENVKVQLVKSPHMPKAALRSSRNFIEHDIISSNQFHETIAGNCNLPSLIVDNEIVVAGLCAVCRNIVKLSDESHGPLLGFKNSCLLAPSEASIWTKFCEVDIVQSMKLLIEQLTDGKVMKNVRVPDEVVRFENHMEQPLRMHNIYKLARKKAMEKNAIESKELRKKAKDVRIASSVPIDQLNLEHIFAEGQEVSIADVILYPCILTIWNILTLSIESVDYETLEAHFPFTSAWMSKVQKEKDGKIQICIDTLSIEFDDKIQPDSILSMTIGEMEKCSLYKSDPKRYNSSNRMYTRQQEVEASLEKVNRMGLFISSQRKSDTEPIDAFDWKTLPFDALPEGGALPAIRLKRKKHQLESLAREVIRIARDGDRIVDFCSGTGHLGIILACKLPNCIVYLLENKEESLARAIDRVHKLHLNNVRFFQCNLDYFVGPFEIGTSLHACGVATDIVLMHCLERKARFVSCPCCYGGCHRMPHISYPRSERFRTAGITEQNFMHIAHSADQAHDLDKTTNREKSFQGQFCMDIVDTDRKLHAEECGYQVTLTRLQPEDCTPKNRLLVGII